MGRRATLAKANSTHLLALDLSLNRPGYAVLEIGYRGEAPRMIKIASTGHLRVNTSNDHGARLREIRTWIDDVVRNYDGRLERVFAKEEATQSFAGHILQKAHGVAEELLADFAYADYGATTIKLLIGGHGKADKKDVEAGVREILALSDDFKFGSDDEADAVACGLVHLALTDRLPPGKRYDALRVRVDEWRSKRRGSKKAKGSA